jgi:hypothetical protein
MYIPRYEILASLSFESRAEAVGYHSVLESIVDELTYMYRTAELSNLYDSALPSRFRIIHSYVNGVLENVPWRTLLQWGIDSAFLDNGIPDYISPTADLLLLIRSKLEYHMAHVITDRLQRSMSNPHPNDYSIRNLVSRRSRLTSRGQYFGLLDAPVVELPTYRTSVGEYDTITYTQPDHWSTVITAKRAGSNTRVLEITGPVIETDPEADISSLAFADKVVTRKTLVVHGYIGTVGIHNSYILREFAELGLLKILTRGHVENMLP